MRARRLMPMVIKGQSDIEIHISDIGYICLKQLDGDGEHMISFAPAYASKVAGALTGMLSPAMIITAFLTGWPSIIAVILNYVKRSEVRGTWLDSHFSWQIRTFWFALLWLVIGGVLFATVLLIPFAFAL